MKELLVKDILPSLAKAENVRGRIEEVRARKSNDSSDNAFDAYRYLMEMDRQRNYEQAMRQQMLQQQASLFQQYQSPFGSPFGGR